MDVVTVIKEHPLSIVAAAVVILIIISSSRSSGGGNSVVGATLQSQQIATQGNTAIAQINANVDIARGAQNVDMYKTAVTAAAQAAAVRTSLISSIFDTSTKTSATLAGMDTQARLQQTMASFQHQDNQTSFANQLELGKKSIDAGVLVNGQKMDALIQTANNDAQTKLKALGMSLDSNKTMFGMSLDYQSKKDVLTSQSLPTILQNSQEMAKIAAANAQAIAAMQTYAQRTAATTNAVKDGYGIAKDIFGNVVNAVSGNGSGGDSSSSDLGNVAAIASLFI